MSVDVAIHKFKVMYYLTKLLKALTILGISYIMYDLVITTNMEWPAAIAIIQWDLPHPA